MENERDHWTATAMEKYGGSFVEALSDLVRRADANNLAKIKATWPEYWKQYEEMGKEIQARAEKKEHD